MFRSVSARALAGVVILVAACGPSAAGGETAVTASPGSTPRPSAIASPMIASSPSTAASPVASSASAASTFDTTKLHTNFDLPLTLDLPAGWIPLTPPVMGPKGTFGFVRTGNPPEDDTQWWGAGLVLVAGGYVADPAAIGEPAAPGDAMLPWPASYVDYLVGLPHVTVAEGPSPVTIGGVEGRRVILTTPAMHPTIFLKGDTTWLGGGRSGLDPGMEREVIELTVNGKPVLIEYDDGPESFDQHRLEVDAILDTLEFKTPG